MSLLDTASLIVTPNGVKEGKLYSVIPSDGSGDMSVTRATTATRVNSAGLVELVPYNLLTYSNTFSNAAWTKTNTTVTSGQSGYDGTSNAWKLQATATNNCEVDQGFSESETKNFSIYAKAGNVNFVAISVFGAGYGWYNLSNGTLGSSGGTFVSRNIESVGNGWYRCSIVTNVAASGVAVYVCNADNSTATSVGSNIFIQNSQLESGNVPTTYQKTETRLNIPRLDYSNGTCPSLLVEPQRTNVQPYSEDLSQVNIENGSVTTNVITSPSGIQNADLYTENTTTSYHRLNNGYLTYVSGQSYTFSVYAKANGTGRYLVINALSAFNARSFFDLNNGTVALAESGTATIENVGNGWYRCSVTNSRVYGTGTDSMYFGLSTGLTDSAYTGNGTTGFYAWGMQLEAGSYATSYIPTTSASVTRNADVISKTGISSLIGQTEGTIFLDFVLKNPLSATNRIISITESVWDSGGSIRLDIDYNKFTADFVNGGSNIGTIIYSTTPLQNTRYKVAIAYKVNDCQMYVNGVDAGSDTTTAAMPTCSELYLNALGGGLNVPYEASNINASALWKTRLTNAQLATLTTI